MEGSTLYVACDRHYDVAKLLLERNADVSKCGDDGTPLYVACERGHIDVVRLLLEY